MNRIQKAAVLATSTAALGLGAMVAVPAAEAHVRGIGTVNINETAKLVRQAAQQRCLTVNEVRRITHGNGVLSVVNGNTRVTFDGTVRSGILRSFVVFGADGCATNVAVVLR